MDNKLNDHGAADGAQKHGGLASFASKLTIGKGYTPTSKFLIVGKSGSGKTQLAFDLAYYMIKPYSSIVYICDHFEDQIVLAFERGMSKAGMPFYEITVDSNGGINVPDVHNSLFIIDDYYTSTNRPKGLETLLLQLVNKGRHSGNHVIYIAHGTDYLPKEIVKNNNGVFVDKPYDKFPVSKKIVEPRKFWYMITNDALSDDATIQKLVFPGDPELSPTSPPDQREFVQHMKRKIPPEDKGKKIPDKQDYEAMSKQGNKYAAKVAKKMTEVEKKEKLYGYGRPPESLPMFGDISCKDVHGIVNLKSGKLPYDFSRLCGN